MMVFIKFLKTVDHSALIPHLFRTEYSKIIAVLCKTFGMDFLESAEDIASETFSTAMLTWPYKGIPPHPTAWLYTVAKNKAKNQLWRSRKFNELSKDIKIENHEMMYAYLDLSNHNIKDSQLQMLFAICHPVISVESQIGLALRILCGFGIDEIATAFLTNKETINKRLYRAKEKLRESDIQICPPNDPEIETRLETVITTLYLLFNEGYYSETNDQIIREDLCAEALRLAGILSENILTNTSEVNALLALMNFQYSRIAARKNNLGDIILYDDQDDDLWDQVCIQKGVVYLHKASTGDKVSSLHLEATIAWWHTQKEDTKEKWNSILMLYDHLLKIKNTNWVALHRIYAMYKISGYKAAIIEIEKLPRLENQYYYTLLGELYVHEDKSKARAYFIKAIQITRLAQEKKLLEKKIMTI